MRTLMLLMTLCLLGCGGVSVTPNPAPVEVTFQVTSGGQPVNDVVFNFQPVAEGLQAQVPVEKGTFRTQVTPGTYTYFVSAGKSEANLNKVPAGYHRGALDRTLIIQESGSYNVDLD